MGVVNYSLSHIILCLSNVGTFSKDSYLLGSISNLISASFHHLHVGVISKIGSILLPLNSPPHCIKINT